LMTLARPVVPGRCNHALISPHTPTRPLLISHSHPATIVAKFLQRELPDRTFVIGELSFEGPLRAVAGLRAKLKLAAERAARGGWQHANVIIPMANVDKGQWLMDEDGAIISGDEELWNLRQRLRIIPVKTELDALRVLFNPHNGAWR
jgi:hypothetical protein